MTNHSGQAWPAEQCISPALQDGSLLRIGQAWPSSPAMLVEMDVLFSVRLSKRLILQ